jgi:murein peptide amidase A
MQRSLVLSIAVLLVLLAAAPGSSAASATATASSHPLLGDAADTTAPQTACDAPSGWQNAPFVVHFTATDTQSGVAATWFWIDDDPPQSGSQVTVPAPPDHSFDGLHTLSYYSVDNAGNQEAPQVAALSVDTTGPTIVGRTVRGFTGRATTLKYEVLDALSPRADNVVLTVSDDRGRVVARLALGTRSTGLWYGVRWTPPATGTYRYSLSAEDLAGNAGSMAVPAEVVVKGPWWQAIGHSVQRRAIVVARFGSGTRRLLVVGGVHGNEFGTAVARRLAAYLAAHPRAVPSGTRIDVILCANPDGYAHGTRGNARGVDLNRNLPTADWRRVLGPLDEPGNPGLSGGRRPGSEPETKALIAYLRIGFEAVISLHSRAGILDCNGPGAVALGRRMAALCGLPVGRLSYDRYITGSLGEYVPARLHIPVVTVELRSPALSGGLRAALLAAAAHL